MAQNHGNQRLKKSFNFNFHILFAVHVKKNVDFVIIFFTCPKNEKKESKVVEYF